MKNLMMHAALCACFVFAEKSNLIGRWRSKPSPTGAITTVVFKTDSTFEGFVNNKPFVTAKYTLEDDVFSFTDNGCDGMPGSYRLIFFSNSDSMRFEVISDNCVERKQGMGRLMMGRVK